MPVVKIDAYGLIRIPKDRFQLLAQFLYQFHMSLLFIYFLYHANHPIFFTIIPLFS